MNIAEISIEFTGGTGIIDRAIQAVDRTPNGPSAINHVLLAFQFADGPHIISQSRAARGVHLCPYRWLEWAKEKGDITTHIKHVLDLSPSASDALWEAANEHDGLPYDHWRIVGYMAWLRLRPRNTNPCLDSSRARYTCNEHVQDASFGIVSELSVADELTPTRMCYALTGMWPERK